MYLLELDSEFCAAHAIRIGGEVERVHGHNWRVRATIGGAELDDDGLLCDFHEVAGCLERIIEPFRNGSLNETPPFDRLNPTAEMVARHIGECLSGGLASIREGVGVVSVRVTEAAGCAAVYCPEQQES